MAIEELFDDEELAGWFGRSTLQRGVEYAEAGRVGDLRVNDRHPRLTKIQADVEGTRFTPYAVTITVTDDASGTWLASSCTCPMVRGCKHAAAVMVVLAREYDGRGRAAWERRLGLVLDELEEAAEARTTSKVPLALQIELHRPPTPRWGATRSGPQLDRGSLRMRPLLRGARGWIKSGAAWHDVSAMEWRRDLDPRQVAVLAELLAAHRAANRQSYYGAESHLTLATAGSSLWPLLREARQAGIELVAAGGLGEVRLLDAPVTLQVDVNGGDDADRGGRPTDAHLALGIRVGDDWFGADRLEVLGASGHGVALFDDRFDHRDRGGWSVLLSPLSKPAGPHTRRLLASAETLAVPQEQVPELVSDYLPRLRRHLPVVSSDASIRLPEVAPPRLALTVTWKSVDEVHLAWSWRYRVGGEDGDDRVYGLDEQRGRRGLRDLEAEAAVVRGLELDDEQRFRLTATARPGGRLVEEQVFRGLTALAFAEDTLVPLAASGQVEIDEIGVRPDYYELTDTPVVRFVPRTETAGEGVDARNDWLDLEVIISIGDRFISLPMLIEALTRGAERIILSDGAHLRIDGPEFAQLAELVRAARELEEQPSGAVRVSRHDLGLWAELAEIGVVDAQASQWVQAARALRDLEGLPAVEPVGVQAELRHYQAEGFRWLAFLWQSRLGGILADDMGLGKTLQTLALVAHARAHGAGPFLVVAPTSVVATWASEAAHFTPHLTVRTVTESRARRGEALSEVVAGADLVVTSYTLFRLEAADHTAQEWGGLVLDEAQLVKNHQGKTYQAVRRLDVPFRLALTGTPMENRLIELWALLSIVAPGLYPYPQRFTENVANPVEKEGDTAALDRFRRRIRPFLLRRTKDLVAADLPPKQEQVLEVVLSPRHRKIYETHLQRERQHVLGLLGDYDKQRIAIFRSLTRLRQLSLDAALVDSAYDGTGSAKIDVLVDHLHEVIAEGHRALVFSQFTSFLTRVRRRLDDEGITARYLDGRTRKRAEEIGAFKRGDAGVFLISLKAGGVGLTLTEADYVFVLDPWWNPAVEAQAVDRAHRIGQQRPVIVYRLVSTGTIEEKVMELKARKAALFAKVVDGEGTANTPITAEDVRQLFADD